MSTHKMKDIGKFALNSALMYVALTLVGIVFIPSFLGDLEWLRTLVSVGYVALALAAGVYDGVSRGAKDCKFTALMEKQQKERDYQISDQERQRMYDPKKGFIAGLFVGALGIVTAIVAICLPATQLIYATPIIRVILGMYLGLFTLIESWLPWAYLLVWVLYPLAIGAGYLLGVSSWNKEKALIEKSKRRRKVRKKKKAA